MRQIAKIISTVGNPLLTIPLLIEIIAIRYGHPANLPVVTLITAVLFVSSLLWIFYQYKKGSYSDMDVSKREQRYSLYLFIIPLVFLTAWLFYLSNLPTYTSKTLLIGGGLMTLSFLTNFKIKSSLHTSLNCYLAFCVFQINPSIGMALLVLTVAVAWSRVVLQRHSVSEVVMGFLVGGVASVALSLIIDSSDFELLLVAG